MSHANAPKSAAALYASLLQSCIGANAFRQGKSVHHRAIITAPSASSPPDLHLSTKLIIFYSHFGDVAAARAVFDGMPHRSIVSWRAMVPGHAKNGRSQEALELFAFILRSGARPNQFTFGSAFPQKNIRECGEGVRACPLHKGRGSGAPCAAKGRHAGDMFVQRALMNMHQRCGSVGDVRRLFAEMERNDLGRV